MACFFTATHISNIHPQRVAMTSWIWTSGWRAKKRNVGVEDKVSWEVWTFGYPRTRVPHFYDISRQGGEHRGSTSPIRGQWEPGTLARMRTVAQRRGLRRAHVAASLHANFVSTLCWSIPYLKLSEQPQLVNKAFTQGHLGHRLQSTPRCRAVSPGKGTLQAGDAGAIQNTFFVWGESSMCLGRK
jgi:hypothetical protein